MPPKSNDTVPENVTVPHSSTNSESNAEQSHSQRHSNVGIPVEVHLAGLLLTDEHLRHLCLTKYGYTEEDLERLRPTDLATLYYSKQEILDGADLVTVDFYDGNAPPKPTYLLPCAMAIIDCGMKVPPLLPLSRKAVDYASRWFDLDKLTTDPVYRDVKLIQLKWPREILPCGIVYEKLQILGSASFAEKHRKEVQDYLAKKGIARPPMLPIIYGQRNRVRKPREGEAQSGPSVNATES